MSVSLFFFPCSKGQAVRANLVTVFKWPYCYVRAKNLVFIYFCNCPQIFQTFLRPFSPENYQKIPAICTLYLLFFLPEILQELVRRNLNWKAGAVKSATAEILLNRPFLLILLDSAAISLRFSKDSKHLTKFYKYVA